MTISPPQEATHFRGKTLTPESPAPVHVPEPQNIPVLMNQIDPSFNDMSTYMESRYPPQVSNMISAEGLPQQTTTVPQNATLSDQPGTGQTEAADHVHTANSDTTMSNAQPDSYEQASRPEHGNIDTLQGNDQFQELSITSALANIANGSYAPLSTSASDAPTILSPSQGADPSASITQDVTASSENIQDSSPSQDIAASTLQPSKESDAQSQVSASDANGEGVNYQALLDNLSPSNSTAPAGENLTVITTAAPSASPSPSSAQTPIATLPVPAGLPPRPPPQEKPAIHHNYTPGEDIRTYHNPPAQVSATQTSYSSQSSNPQPPPRPLIHNGGVAPNGMPPPPIATFQQSLPNSNQVQPSPQDSQSQQKDNQLSKTAQVRALQRDGEDEYPRRPEVEALYDEFLREEAVYVAEGTWDRFPQGSRLFIGNLFTEQVTKRDIFYVFHKYGRLAQISMKSAYGFVQYHDVHSCMRALQSEQSIEIRGRKINLEVSKPQKNTRNAQATAQGDKLRATFSRRSRSPDYMRGGTGYSGAQRPSIDHYSGNAGPLMYERRMRDDYRPGMRSISPQGYRGRDEFRPNRRSPDRYYRGRSRSPGYDRSGRYRSRSPRYLDPDDEANLPIMRRNPRDVPDVQIILVDEVDRTFVGYIQQSFRDRGLHCDVLQLPRVSLAAVVKRQVVEGVQAVVKIFRRSQNTGKIPLQVYNRSGGADNVRFDDYEDLDANVAAELVVRAKTTHLAPTPAPSQYPPPHQYGAPQYQQPHQPMQQVQPQHPMQQQHQQPVQPGGQPPNLANLITSLDGPALQKLLGAMQQAPQTPSNPQQQQHISPQQPGQTQDLSSLLQSVSQQQQQQQPSQQQQAYQYNRQYSAAAPQQQQPQPQQAQHAYPTPVAGSAYPNVPVAGYGARPPQQQGYAAPPQQQQAGQQPQHNVQDMLAQLARYKQ